MKARILLVTALLLNAVGAAPVFAQTIGSGSALSFDGAGGHLQVPAGVWFNGNFTVEAWVYLRSYNGWSRLIDFGNGPYAANVFVGVSADVGGHPVIATYPEAGDSDSLVYSTRPLPLNQWTHLAASFNSNTGSIYINGELVGSGPMSITPPNLVRTNNYIGRSNWPWDGYANAIFDELRIWNTARSSSQIAATMRNRVQGTETNLLGYWRFNENTGTQTADSSGHSAPAVLGGGATWTPSTAPVSAVNVLSYWRLGEHDAGAVPGATNSQAIDSTDSRHLTMAGRALYSTDVPASAQAGTRSTLSVNFSTAQTYGLRTVVSTALDNFGVEAWVKPTSVTGGQTVVYNGSTATSGWGITLNASNYAALFGGRVAFGMGAATPNVWTHVALIRDNGVSTLYVNGVPSGSSPDAPNLPAGNFALAVAPQVPTGQTFTGLMDEVRVFTFTPGQFSTNDLLFKYPSAPEVSTMTPTMLTTDTATLNGTMNPGGLATTAWFEWGLLTPVGKKTGVLSLPATNSQIVVSSALTNLTPGFAYQYRLVASNALGVIRGQALAFWAPTLQVNGSNPLVLKRQTFVDPGATAYAAPVVLAGAQGNSLALKADGSVLGWGRNMFGELNPPPDATNVIAIAAGDFHTLALNAEGRVLNWGYNPGGLSTAPPSATNVNAIAAGLYHSLALRADGTVIGWGLNNYGQVNIPPNANNAVAIAAGYVHSVALRSDGAVVAWGDNSAGQVNVPPGATNVVAIAVGVYHNLALRANGTVVGWGRNDYGQASVPPVATNVVAIAAGMFYSLALKADGTLIAWGGAFIPPNATNVVAVASGDYHILALKADGTVLAWGSNNSGEANVPPGLANLNLPVVSTGNVDTSLPGNYPVNYFVTNAYGIVTSDSRMVTVIDSPAIGTPSATVIATNPVNGLRTVRFHSLVNPNGSPTMVAIAYGLTASYGGFSGTSVLPGVFTAQSASADVSLSPGFTWHWRVAASNGMDTIPGSAFSPDQVFTTPAPNSGGDANGDGVVDASELNAIYATYLSTGSPLAVTNVVGLGRSNVTFALNHPIAGDYNLEVSTNLVDWQSLGPVSPRYRFTDTNAPATQQNYYRVRWP